LALPYLAKPILYSPSHYRAGLRGWLYFYFVAA